MERPGRYRYRSLWARKIRKCLPLGEAIQLQGNQRSRIGVCIELAGDSTWTSFLVPFWLVLWMVFNLYDAEASWPNETRPCTKSIQSFMVSKARTLKAAESFPRKMLITIDLLPTSQQRHSGASAVCRWFSMWSETNHFHSSMKAFLPTNRSKQNLNVLMQTCSTCKLPSRFKMNGGQ